MIVKIEFNNVTFTEWLEYIASRSIKGSDLWEAVLGIPRDELIKKSDSLFELLDSCYDPEDITEDNIREIICYDNWGIELDNTED